MKPLSVDLTTMPSGSVSRVRASDQCDLPVRMHRVLQARRAIARGDYDRPAVLEAAAESLLQSGHL